MSARLTNWIEEITGAGMTESEIAAGLDNGDSDRPEWLGSSPCTAVGYAIWDIEEKNYEEHLYNLDTTPPEEA